MPTKEISEEQRDQEPTDEELARLDEEWLDRLEHEAAGAREWDQMTYRG